MKLLTFVADGVPQVGVLNERMIISLRDLARAANIPEPANMLALIANAEIELPRIEHELTRLSASLPRIAYENANILAPIPLPRSDVIGVGMNYVAHVEEAHASMATSRETPKAPVYFTKRPASVVGPSANILYHADVTRQLDWEAELGVIIGKRGKKIARENVFEHIFGYTCLNDISARDCRREHQWFLAKAQDGSCPMGPVIVTRDEISNPQDLNISLRVNGAIKQQDNTSRMIFDIVDIIEDLSRAMTLEPGDIIATGTPSGVGIGANPPTFLQAGDIVEMEIDGIGQIRNRVELA